MTSVPPAVALSPSTELTVKVLPLAKTTSSRPAPGTTVPPVRVEAPAEEPKRMPPVAMVRVLPAPMVAVRALVLLKRSELIVCVAQLPVFVLTTFRLLPAA